MSEALLRQLSEAQSALMAALDERDLDAIDAANGAMEAAVASLRAAGNWQSEPGLGAELVRMLKVAETARGHVNLLADRNRRNLDKLMSLAGVQRGNAYGRSGLLA